MSYINKDEFKLVTRRPALLRNLSYAELLTRLDNQAKEANELIAKSEARALHWFEVAAELEQENRRLRAENEELRRENGALRKRLKAKAGRRRGEWDGQ